MSWECPACKEKNDDSLARCLCGYEIDSPFPPETTMKAQESLSNYSGKPSRPVSVSIVSALLGVGSLIILCSFFIMSKDIGNDLLLIVGGTSLLQLVIAVGLFLGKKWARILLVALLLTNIARLVILIISTSPTGYEVARSLTPIVPLTLFTLTLYNHSSNIYFNRNKTK